MYRLPRSVIALLTALLLVLAQQAALAHMIGHTGSAAQTRLSQGEDHHNAALSLSHACTTCIAFAALDAFSASASLPRIPAAISATRFVPRLFAQLAQRAFTAQARAPPFSL